MSRLILLTGLFIACLQQAYAVKDDFAVSHIPDSLLQHANSVIRFSEIIVDVQNAGRATYHFHQVVTVLNEAGAGELTISFYYNQFRKLSSFKAALYDKQGKLMNRRSEADLDDYGLHDGFSLFNDARFKRLQTSGGAYPVTLDYTYTLEYEGLLDYPDWEIMGPQQSVEEAVFAVEMPANIGLKYKCANINLQPSLTTINSATTYTWSVKGLKAIKVPVNSYDNDFFLPMVDVTPAVFEIAGYKGSWDSWQTFGRAMNDMWHDSRNLSDEAVSGIQKLVAKAATEREKVELVYAWLQHNFRYVSVQIGIGGYIPFNAATVQSTKYGDCKALSNYMCAALSAVGVKSYPALINAGSSEHPIDTAFPSNKFNHAILCAMLADGPLWLECTSNAVPCGELGTFTENRYALLLTENGGRVVKTPAANAAINTLMVKSHVAVDSVFKAQVFSHVALGGEFRQNARQRLVLGNEKERAFYIFNNLGLKQNEQYEYEHILDSAGQIFFNLNGSNSKIYEFKAAGKTFLPSTLIKSWYENVSADSSCNCDILLDFPAVKSETLVYELGSLHYNNLPANYTLDNKLVHFARSCETLPDNTVSIRTSLSVKNNIISAAELPLLKESLGKVSKYLQQKLIIE